MNCIITLKINDYYPKLEFIPYENFICLLTFGEFKGKISLSEKYKNQCTHEISKINTDIKYTIHILDSNSNSLIGICEFLIPLFKFKQVNPPCKIIQEQNLKIIMDTNTKRKLFKTLINSSDIFLVLRAEIFVASIKNIGNSDFDKIEVKRKKINFNKENIDLNKSSHNNKKKKIIKEIKSNKEKVKNDLNISNNIKNNNRTISYDNKNNNNNISKIKLMNDIKNSFKKIDEINLSSKGIKKARLNQKRSPKKRVTILELMEQKMQMQPILFNISKEKNEIENMDKKINIKPNKTGKTLISPKSKKESKKEIIESIEKHSSKNCMIAKNSNEITSSNNLIKKNSSKFPYNKTHKNDDEKIYLNRNHYDNNCNKDKLSYDKIQMNKSKEYSYLEYDDINSNYGILSTDERTEQVLSEIDKIILDKSTQLRDILEYQIKNSSNHKKISGTLYMKDKSNINKTMEINDNNISINRSSVGNNYNNNSVIFITQENLKNNYISLIDLYHLLNQKLVKIIQENIFSSKKSSLLKEETKSQNKKNHLIIRRQNNLTFNSIYNINLEHYMKNKFCQQLINVKNLESKLFQTIFDLNLNGYEIIRQKEIERVNKLNKGRKLNILLKLIKCIIFDIGNVSQVFKNDKKKQCILKNILENNGIKETKEGNGDCVNIWGLGIANKFFKNENFENKIIKEVDEDKEEESEFNSSNKKKIKYLISKSVSNEINIIPNNLYDNSDNNKPKKDEEKVVNENLDINEEIDENKKIELIKDLLVNKYQKNKKFVHINNNEFLFNDKFQIKAFLSDNNEIFIEIENNKYNMDSFLSKYCKEENLDYNNEINKKEKTTFIYTKKIMTQNEHQKRRRKRRIFDDSEDEN